MMKKIAMVAVVAAAVAVPVALAADGNDVTLFHALQYSPGNTIDTLTGAPNGAGRTFIAEFEAGTHCVAAYFDYDINSPDPTTAPEANFIDKIDYQDTAPGASVAAVLFENLAEASRVQNAHASCAVPAGLADGTSADVAVVIVQTVTVPAGKVHRVTIRASNTTEAGDVVLLRQSDGEGEALPDGYVPSTDSIYYTVKVEELDARSVDVAHVPERCLFGVNGPTPLSTTLESSRYGGHVKVTATSTSVTLQIDPLDDSTDAEVCNFDGAVGAAKRMH